MAQKFTRVQRFTVIAPAPGSVGHTVFDTVTRQYVKINGVPVAFATALEAYEFAAARNRNPGN